MPSGPSNAGRTAIWVALAALLAIAVIWLVFAAGGDGGGGRGGGGGDWRRPGFCGHLDCPKFTIDQKDFNFVIREYEEANWVATNITSMHYELAVKITTPYLLEYFWGANNESLRMKETVPLTLHYKSDASPHTGQQKNFTVAMFLPYEYQDAPPQPNNTNLWIYRNPKATLAVRMFEHRPREWRVVEETRALIDALNHAGYDDLESGEVLVANYDHPGKHGHRRTKYHHSEVWMRGDFSKKHDSSSSNGEPARSL